MLLTLTLAAFAAVFPSASDSQDQFERQVRQQLNAVTGALRDKGFELTHRVYTGELDESRSTGVTFRLRPGLTYAVVAVCDTDCDDVDMRVESPSGRRIGRDEQNDDTPVVEFTSERGGAYKVTVTMADCDSEPCTYGIGVYAKGEDEFERQVYTQLDAAARELRDDGFRLTHEIFTGSLDDGEREDVTFEFERGGVYMVIGVCDTDCDDFDLELRDESGRRVDEDETDDDVPVVAVSPSRGGRYTVRATMASCGDDPCRYGLGVVKKR
jgi:hypothetical protein